jgi:aquaporin Z
MDASFRKYLAEFLGTATLVLMGCGAVTIGSTAGGGAAGITVIALTFGLTLTAIIYAIGGISGAHVNPAVTIGAWFAGKFPQDDVVGYIVAQILGALAGAALLGFILSGKAGGYNMATAGFAQNGWGAGFMGGYSTQVAFITELVATFILVSVILTVSGGNNAVAGLVIGLTLVALHFAFINVTALSVNPARSLGPAVIVKGHALEQLWLFLLAPALGGALAGLVQKKKK